MHSIYSMNLRVYLIFVLNSLAVSFAYAQIDSAGSIVAASKDSVSVKAVQNRMSLQTQAEQALLSGHNKEAFALLLEFEERVDSIQREEKKDTLAAINSGFKEQIVIHQANSESLTKEIADLESGIEKLSREEQTALAMLIGVPIVSLLFLLICLRIGISTKKKFRLRRDKAAAFLTAEKQAAESGSEMIQWSAKHHEKAQELSIKLSKLLDVLISELPKKPKSESDYSPAQQILIRLKEKTNFGLSLSNAILAARSCDENNEDINETWDLNTIARQAADFCTLGESLNMTLQYDLEKSLPNLQSSRDETTKAVILLISIAVRSLHKANELENFKPVMSVSSRILPSFLQVRIKDNGMIREPKPLDIELPPSASEEVLLELLQIRHAVSLLSIDERGELIIQGEPVGGNDFLIKLFRK